MVGGLNYLNVPVFSESCNDAFFDGAAARAANRNTHFVVASQAIQLVHIVGGETGTAAHLARTRIQFNAAGRAIEMVRMINFAAKLQRLIVDDAATKNRNIYIE